MSAAPLVFLCWRWKPDRGYRSQFPPSSIAVLHAMLSRHYHAPFELLCITDEPDQVPAGVRRLKLWDDFTRIPSPHGQGYPSCYRRLKMFSREARDFIGPRFVSLDLDIVITGNVTELFDQPYEFRMYGDTAKGTPYNGSIVQHIAGTRAEVWEKFDPRLSPRAGLAKRYIGSDQAWIAVCLGPDEPKFTPKDGVFRYRNEIRPRGGALPASARMVIMHGHHDPWDWHILQRHSWLREHYRL